jgi:hypothetical protein
VVLLDVPGGTYWAGWADFIARELVTAGLVLPEDRELFLITDDVTEAVAEVEQFWRSYHSIRWVGDRLVVRLRHAPTDGELVSLNEDFADLLVHGSIERSAPLPAEQADGDLLELPRLVMSFDARRAGRLRHLIDAINDLPSARG